MSDYVCTLDDGRIIQPNYLSEKFHAIITKSDLPQIRLHDLRHSTVSNLFCQGFSSVQIADWVSHGSPATTMKYYAHADKTSKMAIANALQGMLSVESVEES